MRVVALPEDQTVRLAFDSGGELSEEQYLAFCRAKPDLRMEKTAKGEILVTPPARRGGRLSKRQGLCLAGSIGETDGRGKAFDSSVEFILPDESALSPDASWGLTNP